MDKIAELLYQTGVIPHDYIVTNIQFSDLFGAGEAELTKMKVFAKKEQEGKVLIRHATQKL